MAKKKQGQSGVITILVSLMLTGVLSVGTLVIEVGRYQAAKTQFYEAGNSAGNSMIAAYNKDLYNRFGLLSIDEKVSNPASFKDYLEYNSDRSSALDVNNISTLYTIDTVEMSGMYNLTYPAVLKRQMLARAKFHVVPQDCTLNYYNMEYFLPEFMNKLQYAEQKLQPAASGTAAPGDVTAVSADTQAAILNMYNTFNALPRNKSEYSVILSADTAAILPATTGTVQSPLFSDDVNVIQNTLNDAGTVLGSEAVLLGPDTISTYTELDVAPKFDFISNSLPKMADVNAINANAHAIAYECRTMLQSMYASLQMLSSDKEGNLLLNSYITKYFPNVNYEVFDYSGPATAAAGDDMTFNGACAEYVFSGDVSETINQQKAYEYVLAIRFASDLYSVIASSPSFNGNDVLSVALHISWAYYEALFETELLFKYNSEIPFGKYTDVMSIADPERVKNAFATKDCGNAAVALGIVDGSGKTVFNGTDKGDYTDHLAIALWFVPNSKKLMRTADLIQLEMRYKQRYEDGAVPDFLAGEANTFCRLKSEGKLNSVLPVIAVGSAGALDATYMQSIKYVGY